MSSLNRPALRGAAILFSTIVGAGVLGLPSVIARTGLLMGTAYICGVGLLLLVTHLALADIFEHTKGRLQMAGVVNKILGKKTASLMLVVFLLLHTGALTAYLIGEGQSLSLLFGGTSLAWTCIFFAIGAAIVYRGIKVVASIDSVINALTIIVLVTFGMWGIAHGTHLPLLPQTDISVLLPLGVLLFAFHGTAAIAEVHELTKHSHKSFLTAVVLGSTVPIIIYLLFVWGVVRLTGIATTEVATEGLGMVLGPAAAHIGNAFAALLMGASFITIGLAVQRMYEWDFGLSHFTSWALAMIVPAFIFAIGAREFVGIIATVGGICGSIELIIIAATWWKLKWRHV